MHSRNDTYRSLVHHYQTHSRPIQTDATMSVETAVIICRMTTIEILPWNGMTYRLSYLKWYRTCSDEGEVIGM